MKAARATNLTRGEIDGIRSALEGVRAHPLSVLTTHNLNANTPQNGTVTFLRSEANESESAGLLPKDERRRFCGVRRAFHDADSNPAGTIETARNEPFCSLGHQVPHCEGASLAVRLGARYEGAKLTYCFQRGSNFPAAL